MSVEYRYTIDDAAAVRLLKGIENQKTTLFRTVVIETMRLIGISATSDFMTVRAWSPEGGFGGRTSPLLHINTRRLATSLIDGFNLRNQNRLVGVKESIREINVSSDQVIGKFGSEVPYAAIHEYGGTIPKTPRSRAFFWAMWYNTNAPMWKALALGPGPVRIPARPYLAPAVNKIEPMAVDYARQRLLELTRKLSQ
ncbi:MAG: phage virion morphogenesis protein [candidate division KSB1 bacterium]|nr:phage virion morphogenesis protein [candidate division KSB1 bacterium]